MTATAMVQFRRPPPSAKSLPRQALVPLARQTIGHGPPLTSTSGQGSAEVKSQGNALQRGQALAPADLEVTALLIDSGIHTIYQSVVWNLYQYILVGSYRFQR